MPDIVTQKRYTWSKRIETFAIRICRRTQIKIVFGGSAIAHKKYSCNILIASFTSCAYLPATIRIKWLNKTYCGIELSIDITRRRVLRKHCFVPENCIASLNSNLNKNHIEENADICIYCCRSCFFRKKSSSYGNLFISFINLYNC